MGSSCCKDSKRSSFVQQRNEPAFEQEIVVGDPFDDLRLAAVRFKKAQTLSLSRRDTYTKIFNMIDTDKDGALSKKEIEGGKHFF